MFPSELRYSREHEWVRVEGNRAYVGISHYAQKELGDVVFVDLPQMGETVAEGAGFAVVESVKAVSDIYAPVSGRVVAVNEELIDHPEWINEEPYGKGWIAVIEMDQPDQVNGLLDAAEYEALVSGA